MSYALDKILKRSRKARPSGGHAAADAQSRYAVQLPAPVTIGIQHIDELVESLFIGDSEVSECYSAYDSSIRRFSTRDDLHSHIEEKVLSGPVHLVIYTPDMLGPTAERRIELDERRTGAKFRYTLEGWGLVHVLLEKVQDQSLRVTVSANSEARARKWHSDQEEMGNPTEWD